MTFQSLLLPSLVDKVSDMHRKRSENTENIHVCVICVSVCLFVRQSFCVFLCLIVCSDCMSVSVSREYPCDQVAMLNVTLLYVGSQSSTVRDIAIHLLHLLYKRFFMDDFVLASRQLPTAADSKEWTLMRNELFSGPRCRSQIHLSLTLAKLHPDLTMPMFSGLALFICLPICLFLSFYIFLSVSK